MAKVITFSRQFPAYHPKAGEPTYFVEKIWKYLYVNGECPDLLNSFINDYIALNIDVFKGYNNISRKFHTIRSGKRWKAGDMFSPRVWSGKPYNSNMITIAPDIEIKKVWDFEIDENDTVFINGQVYACTSSFSKLEELAKNDGLTLSDFIDWLKYPKAFSGQIICWDDKIEY
ncbi:hypothetical protein D3C80_677110 [compost metagenome]